MTELKKKQAMTPEFRTRFHANLYNRPWLLSPDYLLSIQKTSDFYAASDWLERKKAEYKPKIVGNTAILPINGMITARYDFFTWFFDGVSTDQVAAAIDDAVNDPTIDKIVLDIDSPGGEVDGIQPLSDKIFEHRDKIEAYVGSMMASAAAWLGTAAKKIVIGSKTTVTGSIGVVAIHTDYSKLEEKIGIKTTEITAGKYKRIVSPHTPLTAEGKATLQAQVDYIYSLFVDAVARNRGISTEKALQMADGKVFLGEQGISIGLVDSIGSLDELVEKPSHKGVFAMAEKPEKPVITATFLAENHPEIVSQIKNEAFEAGRNEGVKTERERIQKISALRKNPAFEGFDGVIDKAISDGKTYEQATTCLVEEIGNRGITLQGIKNDSKTATHEPTQPQNDDAAQKAKARSERAKRLAQFANEGRK